MQVLISRMVEKIKNPYIIFDKNTNEIIIANDVAKNYIGDSNGIIDLKLIFKSINDFDNSLEKSKLTTMPIQISDVTIHRIMFNEDVLVNIFIGYFDDEHNQVFIEIEPKYNFNKTFEALQELSDDILFFVEIEKRSLVLRGELGGKIAVEPSVNNYPTALIETQTIHPDDVELYLKTANDTLKGINCSCEFRVKMADGSYNWFSKTSIIVHDDTGKPIKVLGKLKNIQENKELQYKMTHDLLTKTLNKISFVNLAKKKLSTSTSQNKHAFYFIDIDNFKHINSTYGREFGDAIIENIGTILIDCIRGNDFVGRIGVDEFVIFVSNIKSKEAIISKAEYILNEISKEYTLNGINYHATASIGVALYPEHGKTYNELQKYADIALYNAKGLGKNKINIYENED